MTRETLDAHYGEIGRASDGTLPGVSYEQDVYFDVPQNPDEDYLGALTCVADVLTDNMLEIPVDKVISGNGSPAVNYPRAAISSAVPPTPHYYIQIAMVANQGSDDSYLGVYARYTAVGSDAQYYLLKIFPYVSGAGGSVYELIRGDYGGSTTVIATSTHAPFMGNVTFRWEIVGDSFVVKDMSGAVLGVRIPVLTGADSAITSTGSVGLVIMDGTLTGRDIKVDEVRAAKLPLRTARIIFSVANFAGSSGPDYPGGTWTASGFSQLFLTDDFGTITGGVAPTVADQQIYADFTFHDPGGGTFEEYFGVVALRAGYQSGYALEIGQIGGGPVFNWKLKLWDCNHVLLDSVDISPILGLVRLKLVAVGSTISGYMDDVLMVQAINTTYTGTGIPSVAVVTTSGDIGQVEAKQF